MKSYHHLWHKSISEIPEEQWNNLTMSTRNPFYCWRWLITLEASGSISPKHGWQPFHLSIWHKKSLVGLAPLYIKAHSYGEFVFDNIYVELAFALGLNYYPKIVGMSPLSPIQGFKFFCAEGEDEEKLTKLLMNKIDN